MSTQIFCPNCDSFAVKLHGLDLTRARYMCSKCSFVFIREHKQLEKEAA